MPPNPPEPRALTGFPVHRIRREDRLYRIYKTGRGPWYYSSSGHGRWDLAAPRGTIYFADTEHGAWLEVFPGLTIIDRGDIDKRALLTAIRRSATAVRLADMRAPAARQFGVTLDLAGGDDYTTQQAWAAALAAAKLAGVRSLTRNDPNVSSHTVALFGRSGEHQPKTAWLSIRKPLSADAFLLTLLSEYGIRVIPPPNRVTADD